MTISLLDPLVVRVSVLAAFTLPANCSHKTAYYSLDYDRPRHLMRRFHEACTTAAIAPPLSDNFQKT